VFGFFNIVMDRADSALALGRYEFFPLDRILVFLAKLGLVSQPPDINLLNPRSGVYSTFWGPAYIDFGIGTPIFTFLFASTIRFFERQYQSGELFALPLYALFLVQIAMMPVTSGLSAAATLYANMGLFALWGFHWLVLLHRRKIKPLSETQSARLADSR
jgi:hypothetical protein